MGAVIIGIGVFLAAAGAVLGFNGYAALQQAWGGGVLSAGAIVFIGGLLMVALGFVHRALVTIAEKLEGVLQVEVEDDAYPHHAGETPAEAPERDLYDEFASRRDAMVAARHSRSNEETSAPTVSAATHAAPAAVVAAPIVAAPVVVASAAVGAGVATSSLAASEREPEETAPDLSRHDAEPAPASRADDAFFDAVPDAGPAAAPEPVSRESEPTSSLLPSWFRRKRAADPALAEPAVDEAEEASTGEPVLPEPSFTASPFDLDAGREPRVPTRQPPAGFDEFALDLGDLTAPVASRPSEPGTAAPASERREPLLREPLIREPAVRASEPRAPFERLAEPRPAAATASDSRGPVFRGFETLLSEPEGAAAHAPSDEPAHAEGSAVDLPRLDLPSRAEAVRPAAPRADAPRFDPPRFEFPKFDQAGSEPAAPAFDMPGETQADAPLGPPPAFPGATGSDEAGEPSVTVLKAGVIGGMAFKLFSDGSIEADLPDGTLRFSSLQELRNHVSGAAR